MKYNYKDGVRNGITIKLWVLTLIVGCILGVCAYAFLSLVDADLRKELDAQPNFQHKTSEVPVESTMGEFTFHQEAVTDLERLQHAGGYQNFEPTDNPQTGSINTGVSHNPQVTYNYGSEL